MPPEGDEKRSVLSLIVATIVGFYLLQCLYFAMVTLLLRIPRSQLYLFIPVSGLFHGLFLLGLVLVRKEFVLEKAGRPLLRINLPLVLSFLRFSSVPTVVFLFVARERTWVQYALVPFLGFIFLTDLFDGILARRLNQTTRIGRILDASGDYLLIFVLSILFLAGGFIPLWLFILVLVRLLVQAAGNITLYILRGYSVLRLSFLGKASVFAIFSLYGFEIVEYLEIPVLGAPALVTVLEYFAAAILAAALAEKLLFLYRHLAPPWRHQVRHRERAG